MSGESLGIYSAYIPSLEAAYRVGSRVVHAIVGCAVAPRMWTRRLVIERHPALVAAVDLHVVRE